MYYIASHTEAANDTNEKTVSSSLVWIYL